MKIVFLCIGKTSLDFLPSIVELEKRLPKYINYERKEIPEIKNTKNLSVQEIKNLEFDLLFSYFKTNPTQEIIILDERGKEMDSLQFSGFLNSKMLRSLKNVTFCIGGNYGFSTRINQLEIFAPIFKLSLSKMTFTHQMIRLLLVEQIYRAFTIIQGLPYHNE